MIRRIWSLPPLLLALLVFLALPLYAQDARPTRYRNPRENRLPAPGYQHDRWGIFPGDLVRVFEAFTVSVDSWDDDTGDGVGDALGIPEWVAYEIRALGPDWSPVPQTRPSPWTTDLDLFAFGLAPGDEAYHFPESVRRVMRDAGRTEYERGHLCMRDHARRHGPDADFNSHTMLNAAPQTKAFNTGAWLRLEDLSKQWAEAHGRVWVVTGPVYDFRGPLTWLGEEHEKAAAIPDGFFKLLIREGDSRFEPEVLAFYMPHYVDYSLAANKNPQTFLTSVYVIEALTGLRFLTVLPPHAPETRQIKTRIPTALW